MSAVLLASFLAQAATPCGQPGVIFCNGFEGNTQEINSAWGSSTAAGFVVADPGPFNVAGNKILKLDNAIMANVAKGLGAGYDRLYARYYQKFPAGYDWTKSHHHGFSYASDGGNGGSNYIPNGCSSTDWMVMEPYQTSTGGLHWYVYHPGKETVWGDIFETGTRMVKDQWYCVESMVDLGTPTPTMSGADGILDMWLDDTHYGPNTCGSWPARCGGIWFRTCSTLQLRYVVFMSSAPAGVPQRSGQEILYDDLVVSTQRIGCGSRVPYTQIPLVINTSSLADATIGVPYSVLLAAAGGAKNYTWQIANGSALPPGLSIVSTIGTIRGTPTYAGTYTFTVQVTDQSSTPQTVSKQLTLKVLPSSGVFLGGSLGHSNLRAHVIANRLSIMMPASKEAGKIRIVGASGKVVWETDFGKDITMLKSPVLANGIYMGMVRTHQKTESFRFSILQ